VSCCVRDHGTRTKRSTRGSVATSPGPRRMDRCRAVGNAGTFGGLRSRRRSRPLLGGRLSSRSRWARVSGSRRTVLCRCSEDVSPSRVSSICGLGRPSPRTMARSVASPVLSVKPPLVYPREPYQPPAGAREDDRVSGWALRGSTGVSGRHSTGHEALDRPREATRRLYTYPCVLLDCTHPPGPRQGSRMAPDAAHWAA